MEQFVKSVMRKFVNLISKKQKSAITVRIFEDEINELKRSYPEIDKIYNKKTGKISISPSESILYDYEIVSGSTFATDQKTQQDNITQLITLYIQAQTPQGNMFESALQNQGFDFNFGELMKRLISNSGIQDWDKILIEKTPEENAKSILDSHAQQFAQAMQGGGMQNMNAIPPQPNGEMPMQEGMGA